MFPFPRSRFVETSIPHVNPDNNKEALLPLADKRAYLDAHARQKVRAVQLDKPEFTEICFFATEVIAQ